MIEDFHNKGKEVPHIMMGCCTRWSSFAKLFNKIISNKEILNEFNLLKEDAEDIDEINDVTTYLNNCAQFISRDDTPLYKAYKVIENIIKDKMKLANEEILEVSYFLKVVSLFKVLYNQIYLKSLRRVKYILLIFF